MRKLELPKAVKLALIPLTCATLLSACAPYEPYGPVSGSGPVVVDSPQTLFDRYDTNRDGFLSRGEVEPLGVTAPVASAENAAAAFHRLDANGDGFLSRGEVQSTIASVPGASFDASDSNRDGFLSMVEVMPHLRWLETRGSAGVSFDAYDANRDGFLSRVEADPLLRSRVGGVPATLPAVSFDRLDIDRDGFLSRAEAAPLANPPTFDRYDTNRDGFLSRAEADFLYRGNVGASGGAPYGGGVYGPR